MEATNNVKKKKSVLIRERKEQAQKGGASTAKLLNCPTSPRKMRLVVDLIRGEKVEKALYILKYTNKEAALRVEKLLLSAIKNWEANNEDKRVEDSELYVKEVSVGGGRQLKRLRPAPQGRGYRIRKRSNHVTIVVDSKTTEPQN
ncbi:MULTISPECIES: 50S ribosomal protein L22 [Olivibacter]|jgi:large subunit ribosomal protein L22|uniref:Large ribosomal subunit protein uL22 n=3 Tax=Sphingobacteriaceae TaxID=84566 RepID=F4C6W5_SPHS2|nr:MULTISPECIES: 50S ribosomal protein L22 [Olivibacter]MCL4641531.1 50S ribosomal protein L22 [Olivibacter sp. UJ_SKK_5.1]MDM8177124.1 50S ribosomal protein L22 [Olivibacter sp. 47]MDX3912572.1 50S ribosomal protein L22 [Pseudosphingobacterium sp.]QEL00292.1 50S ribosomal protein L22 [Olivibacter sp. LS-1]